VNPGCFPIWWLDCFTASATVSPTFSGRSAPLGVTIVSRIVAEDCHGISTCFAGLRGTPGP
jgi:hypothetical protein